MKKIIAFVFLLICVIGGLSSPLSAQSFNIVGADSLKFKTDLKGQYRFTYVYVTMADTVGDDVTDSLKFFTYHPIKQTWIPAVMIDLTTNTEIASTASLPVTLTTQKVLAFYELYLYGWKVVRSDANNYGNVNIFIKNVGGGGY